MSCLDDNTVAAFFDGKLAPEARAQVEAHVDACSDCRRLLARMAVVIGPGGEATRAESAEGRRAVSPRAQEIPPTLASPQAPPLSEGQVVGERFRIGRCIGQGGMGAVYAATHVQLGHRLALKVMSPTLTSHPEATQRFLNEARAAAHIASEHVVRVIDVGTLPGGVPFLAMEFLEGEDLSDVVHARGSLPIEEAVDLVQEALEGIAHAHALGIVHRDLKLANLFLARRRDGTRRVKVLDFGISKLDPSLGAPSEASTVTGIALGTPHYMAPEQLRDSKMVDVRADVWAVGVILFRLLTGELPFEGDSMAELILAIGADGRPSLRAKRPDVPPGLDDAVMRCLERDRTKRWSDAGALARALAPFGSSASRASARRVSQVLGQTGVTVRSLPPKGAPQRSPWVLPAGAVLIAAAGGLVTLFAMRMRSDVGSTAPATSAMPAAIAPIEPAPSSSAAAPPVESPSASASSAAPPIVSAPSSAPIPPPAAPASTRPARPAARSAPSGHASPKASGAAGPPGAPAILDSSN